MRLVQLCFDFYMIEAKPENLIGDRAYDSDPLDHALRQEQRRPAKKVDPLTGGETNGRPQLGGDFSRRRGVHARPFIVRTRSELAEARANASARL